MVWWWSADELNYCRNIFYLLEVKERKKKEANQMPIEVTIHHRDDNSDSKIIPKEYQVISETKNSTVFGNGNQVIKKSRIGNHRKNIELYTEFEELMPHILEIDYFGSKTVKWEYMTSEQYTGDLNGLEELPAVIQKGTLGVIQEISKLGYIFLDIKPKNIVYKADVVKVIDINLGYVHYYPERDESLRIWCNLALFLIHAQYKWKKQGDLSLLMDSLFTYTRLCSEKIVALRKDDLLRQWMDHQINWYQYPVESFWSVVVGATSGFGLRVQKKKFVESGFRFNKLSKRPVRDKPKRKPETKGFPKTPARLSQKKNANSTKSTVKLDGLGGPGRDTHGPRKITF